MKQMKQTLTAYTTGPWRMRGNILVAPVIMLTEGVHAGSWGPIFWPAHILQQAAPKWEGVPVVINHPEVNGEPVSINHSREVRNQAIGIVTNPHYDPARKALKAEIRVPANHLSSTQKTRIQNSREVSVGIFGDTTYQSGQWNGEGYIACQISCEPDHLAILPDAQGACSWEDGCGIRTNALQAAVSTYVKTEIFNQNQGGINNMEEEKLLPPQMNEGYRALMDRIRRKLDALDNELRSYFLEELYEDHVIYKVEDRESGESGYYRQNYTVNNRGDIEFTGQPEPVRKEIEYQAMQSYADTNNLLLPAEYNRGQETEKPADDEDVLLPAGLN